MFILMFISTSVFAFVHMYVSTCTCLYIYIYIHMFMFIRLSFCIPTYIHTYYICICREGGREGRKEKERVRERKRGRERGALGGRRASEPFLLNFCAPLSALQTPEQRRDMARVEVTKLGQDVTKEHLHSTPLRLGSGE